MSLAKMAATNVWELFGHHTPEMLKSVAPATKKDISYGFKKLVSKKPGAKLKYVNEMNRRGLAPIGKAKYENVATALKNDRSTIEALSSKIKEMSGLRTEKDFLLRELNKTKSKHTKLRGVHVEKVKQLKSKLNQIEQERNRLMNETSRLSKSYADLRKTFEDLGASHGALQKRHQKLKKGLYATVAATPLIAGGAYYAGQKSHKRRR